MSGRRRRLLRKRMLCTRQQVLQVSLEGESQLVSSHLGHQVRVLVERSHAARLRRIRGVKFQSHFGDALTPASCKKGLDMMDPIDEGAESRGCCEKSTGAVFSCAQRLSAGTAIFRDPSALFFHHHHLSVSVAAALKAWTPHRGESAWPGLQRYAGAVSPSWG